MAEIYGPVSIIPPANPTQENEQELLAQAQQDQEQEFEFRLFSTPTIKDGNWTQTQAQKIVLRESEEETGEGAFILPRRDHKFYISEKAQGPDLLRYQASAVSGEDILKAGKKRAWGLEVPWRVTVLQFTSPSASSKSKSKSNPTQISTAKSIPSSKSGSREAREDGKKTKPNKKRRIILRERKKKKDSAEEARRKEREAKEEAEREKKTRRNREKKVKRKLKEKAKKEEGVSVGDG